MEIDQVGSDNNSAEPVADNVLFCGQQSLHCKNTGNLLFKDYIYAAILLDFMFNGDKCYDKKKSVNEIIEK